MELEYKQLLEDNNLQVSDLSGEARVVIEQLNKTLKGVGLQEQNGKAISEKTKEKVEALDNLVCREIVEQLQGNEQEEEEEAEEEGVVDNVSVREKSAILDDKDLLEGQEDEEEEEEAEEVQTEIIAEANDPKGVQIDADLKVAHEGGKTTITLEELKKVSKTAYDVIFSTYDESGDNGLVTSNYSLIETDENVFTLTKK